MNWPQIKQDSPKAYEAWWAWFFDNSPGHINDAVQVAHAIAGDEYNHDYFFEPETLKGWLERFFDEQGVCVSVYKLTHSGQWNYAISAEGMTDRFARFSTRPEAFSAAVVEAFKILEERL